MSDKAPPPVAPGKAARDARLAEQLRANLARRKVQARGRAGADEAKRDSDTKEQES